MSENSKNITMGEVWKNAIIKFLKIFVAAFSAINLLFALVVFAAPRFGAKLTSFLGLTSAERYCYTKIYKKSNSATDLYNLILFEENKGSLSREFEYINMLMKRDDYSEFCEKLDDASIKACDDKELIAYIGNVNMFLLNQKIKCMYNLDVSCNIDIRTNLASGNLLENTFSTYISIIESQKLSKNQKVALYKQLMSPTMITLIETKIENLNAKLEEYKDVKYQNQITKDFAEKVLFEYVLMRHYEACYKVYSVIGDDLGEPEKAEEYKALWKDAAEVYGKLIK